MDSIIKEFLGMPEHDVDDIKDEAQDLVDALKGTTKQSRKGPVKFLGVIQEPVDDVYLKHNNSAIIKLKKGALVKS